MIAKYSIHSTMQARWFSIGLLLLMIGILSSCANPLPPPGGPKDTIPPSILESFPASGTVNMKSETITLLFSEYVDRGKVVSSLFMNPSIPFETSWSGKELEITFTDSLKEQTTYALTLGTDYADYSGNKPTDAFTLLFSTGNILDSGVIQGKLHGKNIGGYFVFAHPIGDADTLNPLTTIPMYKTQVGTSGQFTFKALTKGAYKLYALNDVYKDGIYDIGTDGYGIPFQKVKCNEVKTQYNIQVRGPKDTLAPLINSVKFMSPGIVEIQCNEPIDTMSVNPSFFLLADSTQSNIIPATAAYIHPSIGSSILIEYPENTVLTTVLLNTKQSTSIPKDFSGNVLKDSIGFRYFNRRDLPLAIPNVISLSLKDSTTGISLEPQWRIQSSHYINADSIAARIVLSKNKTIIPIVIDQNNAAGLYIKPSVLLENDSWYTVSVNTNGLQDSKGTLYKDTSYFVHFKTEDRRSFGGITGILKDVNNGGPYYINVKNTDNVIVSTLLLEKPGAFSFPSLPIGTYTLEAFEDADKSGDYSFGDIIPYIFSERFVVGADGGSITIRPRWTIDGITLTMP